MALIAQGCVVESVAKAGVVEVGPCWDGIVECCEDRRMPYLSGIRMEEPPSSAFLQAFPRVVSRETERAVVDVRAVWRAGA